MTTFGDARTFLLANRSEYAAAVNGFKWPEPTAFNWALDWFDAGLAQDPGACDRTALWIVDSVDDGETKISFAEMSRRSNQIANFMRSLGVKRGDRILIVLGNVAALWETMLGAMKLGAIIIPSTTLLTREELLDRIERGRAQFVVAGTDQVIKLAGQACQELTRVVVGAPHTAGWHDYETASCFPNEFEPDGTTLPDDAMLLYFTSGTAAKPKLVQHSYRSYPIGALSTMYWLGLGPADVHLNISSPGWAKHAWSSLFAPWNAGATIFIVNQPRFEAKVLLSALERFPVSSICAPPTVWRLLIQESLGSYKVSVREACSAGEPLNPEIIERFRAAWGLTIRDGYGQTETTAQIANSPGQQVKIGAMGRPLPGYRIALLDADGNLAREGEVCIALGKDRPAGLMQGYQSEIFALSGTDGQFYRTGDVAFSDDDGYLTFVGRADDVFKSSDYRISPFELESVLLEHPAVAEAAVVPSPDPIKLSVPKAYLQLVLGVEPSHETALSIFRFTRERLAPFKRIRFIEFVPSLPKTISGKIRRVQLKRLEYERVSGNPQESDTFSEADLPMARD